MVSRHVKSLDFRPFNGRPRFGLISRPNEMQLFSPVLGSLVIGLRNPEMFASISTFAALCNPSEAKIGLKAFKNYLGENELEWKKYDATELAKAYTSGPPRPILLDHGKSDDFYANKSLLPEMLLAVKNDNLEIEYREREGFDHA